MIDKLFFLNENWLLPAISCGIVLWLFAITMIWFSTGKRRFVLKTIISFIAVFSLVLIALKPVVLQERTTNMAVLLTQGYSKGQLDSLERGKKNVIKLDYSSDQNLRNALDTLSAIKILGNGVKPYDFWLFDSISTTFIPGKAPYGIIKLNYPKKAIRGDTLNLKGLYHSPVLGNKLLLRDPGGRALDSLVFNNDQTEFRLQTELKVEGKFVYQLVEEDSLGKVLKNDLLPIQILPKNILNILLINEFPSFETKYLKNYLAENGHKLLIRSKITRGRYKYEYFNRNKTSMTNISQDLLKDFDLLIIDSPSLKNLSNTAKNGLKKAIFEDGLGVFIQADAGFFRNTDDFTGLNFDYNRQTSVRLKTFEGTPFTKSPFSIKRSFGLETIHRSDAQIISGYKRNGNGRVGTTVLEKSYQLLLDGKNEVYNKLWTQLLNPISKPKLNSTEWFSTEQPIYVDEPLNFNLHTSELEPTVKSENGDNIALSQKFSIPEQWEGRIYPGATGWQQLRLLNDTTHVFSYFVLDSMQWKSMARYNRMQENERHFKKNESSVIQKDYLRAADLWWFYFIFLLSIGYLWLEPKLS